MLAWSLASVGWHSIWMAGAMAAAVVAATHAVLYKRDSRGAVLWVGLITFLPILGPLFYFGFGINRIKRRAELLRRELERYQSEPAVVPCTAGELTQYLGPAVEHLLPLIEIGRKVTRRSLLPGNRVESLVNGDAAYPAMLTAIAEAKASIALSTFIFERDAVGLEFVSALGAAVARGVEVRVLIDATGTFFSWRSILGPLHKAHVTYARFLPAFSLFHPVSLNLRNHRKLLVVDGRMGFTGGMNIMEGHWWSRHPRQPVQDVQFRVQGPVVAHLQEAFADDWVFTTGEALRGEKWFPPLEPANGMLARGIADGPDEDFEKTRWVILGALVAARRSIRIRTPYFLPDTALISALNLAAMRGVDVRILLPSDGDVPFVQWASAAHWWQLLEHGCRLWVAPPPFDHSKVAIVDEHWVLLGSANWDPRSLRLNFEFNLECYNRSLAAEQTAAFDERLPEAHEVSLDEINARGLATRLRDGIARLGTPFM